MHIVFWDLDKTYLRTEFDTVKDLLRTAFERADEKRTHPGAMTLMRELRQKGGKVHILSGSPEQMRSRLETKLRLDGVEWDSFTLKPNLRNILKFRFRALRDQLGYKLPALLEARSKLVVPEDAVLPRETLVGDDAEADAFIYSLYADFLSGRVSEEMLLKVLLAGETYEDVIERVRVSVRNIAKGDVAERILIHLEGQTSPERFAVYGPRVVPFYNYMQAALVFFEDGRVGAEAVMRVGSELVMRHRFNGDQLARSYAELLRRGHLRGVRLSELADAARSVAGEGSGAAVATALQTFADRLEMHAPVSLSRFTLPEDAPVPDYAKLVATHNPRKKHKTLF